MLAIVGVVPACSDGAATVDASNPFGVDQHQISLVAFEDVTPAHCLGSSSPVEGKAQTIGCGAAGAVEIVAVTRFGDDAPSSDTSPTAYVVGGYAQDACEEHLLAWAEARGLSDQPFFRAATYPDTWAGPGTPLICGARE